MIVINEYVLILTMQLQEQRLESLGHEAIGYRSETTSKLSDND
jgi:hypothetical protein